MNNGDTAQLFGDAFLAVFPLKADINNRLSYDAEMRGICHFELGDSDWCSRQLHLPEPRLRLLVDRIDLKFPVRRALLGVSRPPKMLRLSQLIEFTLITAIFSAFRCFPPGECDSLLPLVSKKTILGGFTSVEARFPFAATLDSDIVLGLPTTPRTLNSGTSS